MANKADKLKLEAFPEEITEEGIRIYGETSYENQMAVLSQFLHNGGVEGDDIDTIARRNEIVLAIHEFLDKKKAIDDVEDINEEYVCRVAESPLDYPLFSDFFNVPFPEPNPAKFTFIDLFNKNIIFFKIYNFFINLFI